jgi:hypothetical protein
MNKIIISLILLLGISSVALADRDDWKHHEHHEHHEYHGGGNHWGWLLGGILIGGVIDHQFDGSTPPQNPFLVCELVPLYDMYGRVVASQQRCHYEYVQ